MTPAPLVQTEGPRSRALRKVEGPLSLTLPMGTTAIEVELLNKRRVSTFLKALAEQNGGVVNTGLFFCLLLIIMPCHRSGE